MSSTSFDLQMGIPHMSRKAEYGAVALVFNISLFFLTLPPLPHPLSVSCCLGRIDKIRFQMSI